jgi:cytochrome c oxidase cbb3-type subunit 3
MPAWWRRLFWGTFLFSLAYLFWQISGGPGLDIHRSYAADVDRANAERAKQALATPVSEEVLTQMRGNPTVVQSGKEVFAARCAVCHGQKGEGLIGPNLTDDHWIHPAATLMALYKAVSAGVPNKGMPAWERQLRPEELRQVVSYVASILGTHVEGKAPQGEPLKR